MCGTAAKHAVHRKHGLQTFGYMVVRAARLLVQDVCHPGEPCWRDALNEWPCGPRIELWGL